MPTAFRVEPQYMINTNTNTTDLQQRTTPGVRAGKEIILAAQRHRPHLGCRAKIAMARARIELEHREHELKSSRRALAASWGDLQPRFERAAADLFVLPAVGDSEQLTAQLRESPDVQRPSGGCARRNCNWRRRGARRTRRSAPGCTGWRRSIPASRVRGR